jgi:hypothetical protein
MATDETMTQARDEVEASDVWLNHMAALDGAVERCGAPGCDKVRAAPSSDAPVRRHPRSRLLLRPADPLRAALLPRLSCAVLYYVCCRRCVCAHCRAAASFVAAAV